MQQIRACLFVPNFEPNIVYRLLIFIACFSWGNLFAQAGLPVIESFSPTVGGEGTRILVKGQFFGANVEKITIGGTPVSDMYFDYFVGWRLTVGTGASGPVVFHTADSFVASKQLFEFVQKPELNNFTPVTGKTGTRITLTGKNFHADTKVFFGGAMASNVLVISDSIITATVSSGSSGKAEVQTPGGKAALEGFSYITSALPSIANVLPVSGKPGTIVQISGDGFGIDPSVVQVRFGAVYGQVQSVTPNAISVAVPAGGSFHLPELTVNGFVVSARHSFSIESKQKGLLTDTTFRHIRKMGDPSPYRYKIKSVDLDGDGLPDLITDAPGEGYKIFRNKSTGIKIEFDAPYLISAISNIWEMAIADFDGDGRPDLAGSSGKATVALRNMSSPGNLRFDPMYSEPANPKEYFRWTDVNGDGKTDLIQIDIHSVNILVNQSAGSLIDFRKNGQTAPMFNHIRSFDFADLDSDGKADYLQFRSLVDSPGVSLIVHKNITTGDTVEFGDAVSFYGGGAPESIRRADLNGDGKIDLIVHHNSGIDYLPNSSEGGVMSFAAPVSVTRDKDLYDFDLADITGDGLPDVVYLRVDDSVFHVCENTSFGTAVSFAAPKRYPLAFNAFQLLLSDLNNSGYSELITLNNDGDISIYSADEWQFTDNCVSDLQIQSSRDSLCSGNQRMYSVSTVKFKETAVFHWLINNKATGISGPVFRSPTLVSNDKVSVIMIANADCGQIRDTSGNIDVGIITDSRFTINVTGQNSVVHDCYTSITSVSAGAFGFQGNPAKGFNPSYQWIRNGIDAGTTIPVLQLKNVNAGEQVWLRVIVPTSCKTDTVLSNKVSLTPLLRIQPSISLTGKTEIQAGEISIITAAVKNAGSSVQYAWYDSTHKHSWQIMPGSARAEIRYSPASTGDQLRCIVISTDSCGQRDTLSVSVLFKVINRTIAYLPIRIYPNPVTKTLNIDHINPADEWQLLRLFASDGRLHLVLPDIRNRTFLRINVSNLAAGTYLIQFMRSTGEHSVIKFVKI